MTGMTVFGLLCLGTVAFSFFKHITWHTEGVNQYAYTAKNRIGGRPER
jgi:hypothetical protein